MGRPIRFDGRGGPFLSDAVRGTGRIVAQFLRKTSMCHFTRASTRPTDWTQIQFLKNARAGQSKPCLALKDGRYRAMLM